MGDSDSGGAGWIKWIIGILVTLAVGAFVPIYLANRDREATPAAQNIPATTRSAPNVVIPTLPSGPPDFGDLTKPANLYASKTSGPAGSKVTLSGDGFKAGEEVVFSMQTIEVGRTTADQTGAFKSVEVTVPQQLSHFPGTQFAFAADGRTSIKHATAPFVVSG
jgi:hypothetical protein